MSDFDGVKEERSRGLAPGKSLNLGLGFPPGAQFSRTETTFETPGVSMVIP